MHPIMMQETGAEGRRRQQAFSSPLAEGQDELQRQERWLDGRDEYHHQPHQEQHGRMQAEGVVAGLKGSSVIHASRNGGETV